MIEKICIKGIRFICAVLTGYLFLQGLFTVCHMQRGTDKVFFLAENPLPQLLAVFLFLGAIRMLFGDKLRKLPEKYGTLIFWMLTVGMSIFLIWWTIQTCFWPYYDIQRVFGCAEGLLKGDFSEWEPGGYAHMWPHQNGLILFVAFLLKRLSLGNVFYAFYFVSIAFYIITIISIYQICKLLFEECLLVNVQGIMLLIWLPYAFLLMCMYGDHIGYGCSMAAVYLTLKYCHSEKKRYLFGAGFSMACGICMKQNCMIILAGILLLLLFNLKGNFGDIPGKALCIFGFLIIVGIGTSMPGWYLEKVIGKELAEGNSKMSHLAMGMQESNKAPGWFNGYNEEVFQRNDYDQNKTAEEAAAAFRASIVRFRENPAYAWGFFNRKLASEWNNPAFEGFQVQSTRKTARELSSLIKSAINDGGKINIILLYLFDIIQSIVLFGVLSFFLLEKNIRYEQLIFGILFIGAFLFFAAWEARARYAAPYFLFLIPYSVPGYQSWIKYRKSKRARICFLAVCAGIVLTAVLNNGVLNNSLKLGEDTESYYEYIHEYNDNFVNFRY